MSDSLMDLCGILYKGESKEREEFRGEKRRGIIPDALHPQHYRETKQDIAFYEQNKQDDLHKE